MVDMAKMIGIPESTSRGYRDRFPNYMPTNGQGRGKRYTAEALEALRIVAAMSREGIPQEEIESALEARFGVAVESQDSQVSQSHTSVSSQLTVAAMLTPEELTGLLKRAMQEVTAPMQEQIITLGNENKALMDSIEAMEKRQVEREATHFDLVDKRLNELSIEPKKGFWSRMFGK